MVGTRSVERRVVHQDSKHPPKGEGVGVEEVSKIGIKYTD